VRFSRTSRPPAVRNRNVRRNAAYSMQLAPTAVTSVVPRRRAPQVRGGFRGLRCSADGIEFLKATIAPRDFPGVVPAGVPDRFGGATFVMQHQVSTSISSSATQDLHLCMLPALPSALWTLLGGASASSTWTGVQFPNVLAQVFQDISASATTTDSFISGFRVLGGTFELIPTTAPASTPGVVYATRGSVRIAPSEISGSTAGAVWIPTGMEHANQQDISSGPHYSGPLASGVYMPMVCNNPDWSFVPPLYRHPTLPVKPGDAVTSGVLNGPVVGFDNGMQSLICTVPTTGVVTSYVVTVSLLVEYLPDTGNLLSYLAHQSPSHDPVAMEIYERFVKDMPVAVPAYENGGFWDRFLRVIGSLGSALSVIPGPFGMIAGGVGMTANAIASAID